MSIPIIPTKAEQEQLERERDFQDLLKTTPLTEEQIYQTDEAVNVILNLVSSVPEGQVAAYAEFVGSEDYLNFKKKIEVPSDHVDMTKGIEILTMACTYLHIFQTQLKYAIQIAEQRVSQLANTSSLETLPALSSTSQASEPA